MKGISNPVDLIKKTLIASLLIQASWFILMAAVDLSTVLTYTVGAIPTSLLATTDEQYKDVRMLGMNTMLNLGDEGLNKDKSIDKTIFNYRSTKKQEGDRLLDDKYLAPCKVINVKFGAQEQSFIIGRVFDQFTGWEAGKATLFVMEPNYCVHYGSLFSFSDFYSPEL